MDSDLVLYRLRSDENGTFGEIIYRGDRLCVTCEDPWNDNQRQISCIPLGSYQCAKYSSPKFPDVWELKNVPGRSAILIHAGNTIVDTHGCILVGSQFGKINHMPAILNSRSTLEMLRKTLPDNFNLTITGGKI